MCRQGTKTRKDKLKHQQIRNDEKLKQEQIKWDKSRHGQTRDKTWTYMRSEDTCRHTKTSVGVRIQETTW